MTRCCLTEDTNTIRLSTVRSMTWLNDLRGSWRQMIFAYSFRRNRTSFVDKGALVLRSETLLVLRVGVANNGLDLVAVD